MHEPKMGFWNKKSKNKHIKPMGQHLCRFGEWSWSTILKVHFQGEHEVLIWVSLWLIKNQTRVPPQRKIFSYQNGSNTNPVFHHLYRPKRSFGQGNIFTSVCHSFCSQGGCLVWSGGVSATNFGGVSAPNFFGGGVCSKFSGGGWSLIFGIRSTFGRYASYWNAFLLVKFMLLLEKSRNFNIL